MKRWQVIWMSAVLWGPCVSWSCAEEALPETVQRVKAASTFAEQQVFAAVYDVHEFAKTLFGVDLASTLAAEMLRGWATSAWPAAERYLLYTNGNIMAEAGPEQPGELSLSDHVAGMTLEEDAEPTLRLLASAQGSPVAGCIIYPLYHSDGRTKGAAVLTIRMRDLWTPVVEALHLEPDETFYALDGDGRELYRRGVEARGNTSVDYVDVAGGADRKGLVDHMLSEGAGESTYAFVDEERAIPSLRHVAWARCELLDRVCILLVERASQMMAGEPLKLAGRWTGAYTLKGAGPSPEEDEAGTHRSGGGFNVLITQTGRHCTLAAVGEAAGLTAEGIVVDNAISAAQVAVNEDGQRLVWYWTGRYDPAKDSIRGEIFGNTLDTVAVRSFFLKRAVEERAAASPATP